MGRPPQRIEEYVDKTGRKPMEGGPTIDAPLSGLSDSEKKRIVFEEASCKRELAMGRVLAEDLVEFLEPGTEAYNARVEYFTQRGWIESEGEPANQAFRVAGETPELPPAEEPLADPAQRQAMLNIQNITLLADNARLKAENEGLQKLLEAARNEAASFRVLASKAIDAASRANGHMDAPALDEKTGKPTPEALELEIRRVEKLKQLAEIMPERFDLDVRGIHELLLAADRAAKPGSTIAARAEAIASLRGVVEKRPDETAG